jgi:hypothetical protein
MPIHVFSKALPLFIGLEYVKQPSIKYESKYESKRRSCNLTCEEITDNEAAVGAALWGFLLGLCYRSLGGISSSDSESLLSKPDGIVASAAANIDGFAGLCCSQSVVSGRGWAFFGSFPN